MSDPASAVVCHLQDAHGMERQSLALLDVAASTGGDPRLADMYRRHSTETKAQLELLEQLLAARGATPSLAADVRGQLPGDGLRLAIATRGAPERVAAALYAYEHFEIATYELLVRIAARADDGQTAAACERILGEERQAAAGIHASLDLAIDGIASEHPQT